MRGGLKRFAVPTADGRRVCHASWRRYLYDRAELLRGILQNLLPFTSATNVPALIALLPRLGLWSQMLSGARSARHVPSLCQLSAGADRCSTGTPGHAARSISSRISFNMLQTAWPAAISRPITRSHSLCRSARSMLWVRPSGVLHQMLLLSADN